MEPENGGSRARVIWAGLYYEHNYECFYLNDYLCFMKDVFEKGNYPLGVEGLSVLQLCPGEVPSGECSPIVSWESAITFWFPLVALHPPRVSIVFYFSVQIRGFVHASRGALLMEWAQKEWTSSWSWLKGTLGILT